MCKKSSLVIAIILLFTALVSDISSRAQARKPNIIWITCEDISPFVGVFGNKLVKTPNIDQLAKEGVRYTRAYTTAGVCAPSRSAIITGMYQTSIGTQHMRTLAGPKVAMSGSLPAYSAVLPDYVKCFPEYLRKAGYYCTNNEKQDYQFEAPVTVWDENGPAASYRNRPAGKPFFSVFNFFITHESQLFGRSDSLRVDSSQVVIPPYYPDTKTVRHDMARLFTNIEMMDEQVGQLISDLKQDGLYENTVIFFFSDHGGALPWMKRELLERGTHIPLIIRFEQGKNAGSTNDNLVSAVDFAPSVLSLAGVKIPAYMQGQAFLGSAKAKSPRKYVYAARDRMDTEYDRVRMVRDKRYRYLYNCNPEKPYYQNVLYRTGVPMMKEILRLKEEGKLNPVQMSWFKTKPVEELYDVELDPDELHNLAMDSRFKTKTAELRNAYQAWTRLVGDMGSIPEKEMISRMWNGKDEPPETSLPGINHFPGGVKISCLTQGASIGYRLKKAGDLQVQEVHRIQTWDGAFVTNAVRNGDKKSAVLPWQVYDGELIPLQPGDTLQVNAMRIGFKPAMVDYVHSK